MRLSTSIAALAAATTVSAQLSTYSAPENISYSVSIPAETAQNGNGDFFFQLMGPATNQWIALGVGSEMLGSMIFVMWDNGDGNVTVSPRLGKGEFMPVANPQAVVTVLEGSGVVDGIMTANVRCSNCSTWEGGNSIDFTSSSVSFIHAYRTGSAIDSTDPSTKIVQHQVDGIPFNFDLVHATSSNVTTQSNPFITVAPGGDVSPTTPSGGNTGSAPTTDDSGAGNDSILKAHGIIMGLTVALLLPVGAMVMRIFSVPWWLHAGVQTFSLLLFTAGFVLGYINAGEQGIRYTGPGKTHTTFGTVIFAFFWLQPISGHLHHYLYKKKGGRTLVSHEHIWFGRIVLILAMINGGLGLQLAANTTGGEIAYGVIAGVVGVTYIAVVLFASLKGSDKLVKRTGSEEGHPEQIHSEMKTAGTP